MTETHLQTSAEVRPLSNRQSMIWAGQSLDPDVPLYNMAHAFGIEGAVDVDAFRSAFAALVAGSDALRTVIEVRNGSPLQHVVTPDGGTLEVIDLSDRADPDREVADLVTQRAKVRFDLATRLYDAALYLLGPDRSVWYLNQHHLICDAWAVSLVLRRQGELYQRALEGSLDEVEPLPRFSDFLETELASAGSDAHLKSVAYWEGKLNEPVEPLRFYGQRPDDPGPDTIRVSAVIDGERGRRLSAFLTRPEVAAISPELTALGFFQTVLLAYLYRITGVDRLAVGTPFHNRSKRAAKKTIGLFMNQYPVTVSLEKAGTMTELAAAVRAELMETLANARFPCPPALEAKAFEVTLNYLQVPTETFGGMTVEDRWIHSGAADRGQSIQLQVRRHGDETFQLHFDLKTGLLDEVARSAVVDQFFSIADAWLDDVDVEIAAIDLLTPADRQRLLVDFNRNTGDPDAGLAAGPTVVDRFEAMATARPERPAVACGRESVDYRTLDGRADRIAKMLSDHGVEPGDHVGVLLPRGIDAVAAILGVLKIGAAYVPIEVGTPPERLATMVADTAARFVLTDPDGEANVRAAGATPLTLADLPTGPIDRFEHRPKPDDPAYVIFTSGSTGRPKGVQVRHRGLTNYVDWARDAYGGGEAKAFALFTSLAFDLTITSVFVPLTSGGSIVAYPDDVDTGRPAVVDVWTDDRVEVVKATPSHLAVVRQLGLAADRVETLIVGGENFTTDLAVAIQGRHPDAAIFNEYGPTETVVGCMSHRFDQRTDRGTSVPIGRPGAGAEIFLLDRDRAPVPPGVVGEIHIGGPGVSRYLGRPEINAERFVERPPSLGGPGSGRWPTLYRTGDLGRWLPRTDPPRLDFLGRTDDQVKLRGYRIELGEIEAVLATDETIERAAVTVNDERSADDETGAGRTLRLVAHYQSPEPLDNDTIRARLARRLPDYMIPTSYLHYRSLPLTANGKIDRAGLRSDDEPDSDHGDRRPAVTLADVADPEAALALQAAWEAIFDRPVLLDDNFFDLGGDSIIAIQIVDRAASTGLSITPRQLFDAQTVVAAAEVATWIDGEHRQPDDGDSRTVYPLTPTQSGMLFHTLAEPDSGIYGGQIVHEMRGEVRPDVMARCWHALVQRHDGLRTVFDWQDSDLTQRVVADVEPSFAVHDLAASGAEDGDDGQGRLDEFLADDRARGFDLAARPPLRLTLVRLPTRTVLVWSFHHIALDGWSIALAINELVGSYQAQVDGAPWTAPVRRGLGAYVDWLHAQDLEAAERFWRAELVGYDRVTALPRTTAVDDTPRSRGYGAAQRTLPTADTRRLAEFATEERVTMTSVLQAAWSLVLARYDGADDVVFGVTTSGRPPGLRGANSIIGMLVTTLPARIRITGDQTPGAWLREIQQQQLTARDYEYAHLADVQRWSELPAGQALFDSILVMENFPDYVPPDRPDALAIESRAYRVQSNFPFSLIVLPGPELTIKAVYDTTRFDEETVERVLDHLLAAVRSLTGGQAGTVGELTTIGAEERARLQDWSTGAALPEVSRPVIETIRQQAEDRPDADAVVSGSDRLSYGELLRRATVVADELRAAGVGPGSFVGVQTPRSIDMVVAIVGIMAAGGAYLPLDPGYPGDRLRFMLGDAGASLVLRSGTIDPIIPGSGADSSSGRIEGTGLVLDRVADAAVPTSATLPPERAAQGDDPAYIIYTSGSTGTPNGVPISIDNLVFSTAARSLPYRHQPSSFLLLSPFSFDSSIVGLFWTLTAGGRLVLPAPGQELDVQVLGGLIERHQVTHTLCLPSLYRLMLDFAPPASLASLTTVTVAGEACPRELVDRHAETLPTAELYNEYGPTEATVWCTVHRCDPTETGPVPIGRPMPGAVVAVLGPDHEPAGVGVTGEIHIAGPGVAAGYHNRGALTAERFVEIDGRRWFRTGDAGRLRSDGQIEFLGRRDAQVKIRGHRVELGEVEAVVGSLAGVAEVAATAVTDPGRSGAELVAFVQLETGGPTVSAQEVQAAVGARLPGPFVPSRVVVVEALPKLPNGKVDRSRLVGLVPPPADRSTAEPVDDRAWSETERQIAAIWTDLLPAAEFGLDDDFFDVGGDSLLAVSLVERIRRATGVRLPLATLLDQPTVAALAANLTGSDHRWRCLVPLRTEGTRVPLYLIPPAAGTSLSFRELVINADPDQPLYCFEPLGTDGISEPHDTVEAMAAFYIDELRAAQPDGRYRIGGSCLGAIVAWEMARQLEDAGTPVELLVFLDPGPPHSGPDWSYRLPSQRSPKELIRSVVDIVTGGEIFTAIRAVWRRNAFERIGRIHYRAQLSYVADRLQAPIIWLESSELAETQPVFLEQWRTLAGEDLTPIIVPDTTHDGLMSGQADEVRRMTALLNTALTDFEQAGR